MKIKWCGHATFMLEANGTRIVTDPYTPEVAGYDPITEPTDIVIMSSATDRFHSCPDMVAGDPVVINALDITETGAEVKGIRFSSVPAMESVVHKSDPDQNAMYRFSVEGIEIGHMGDVGNPLSETQLEFFKGVDILLALTGGPPTIELNDLDEVIDVIQPKLIIPMHYLTDKVKLTHILPVDDFTARFPSGIVHHQHKSQIEVSKSDLPETNQIYVLDYGN